MRYVLTVLSVVITSLSVGAQAGAATAEKPSFLLQMFPFIALFFIFYFFIIRPQAKRQKLQQEFLTTLKRGDEVLTSGGILGTIEGLTDKFVTLEVASGVRIRVLRSQVSGTVKEVEK